MRGDERRASMSNVAATVNRHGGAWHFRKMDDTFLCTRTPLFFMQDVVCGQISGNTSSPAIEQKEPVFTDLIVRGAVI